MTVKSLNHLRVVVHINDGDYDDYDDRYNNNNGHNYSWTNSNRTCGSLQKRNSNWTGQMMLPQSPPIRTLHSLNNDALGGNMKAEVLLIDEKTLQLNLLSNDEEGPYTNISHKMHFDHVSHATIDMMKLELAIVMDEMLLKHNNTGIMLFFSKYGTDIHIFFDLLATFINKRIYHQRYTLQYVKLECLDVGWCLGRYQNSAQEKGFTMRASLAGLGNGDGDVDCDCDGETDEVNKNGNNQFQNTRELLLWLLEEYLRKCNDGQAHEKLQFTFSIVDHQKKEFKVKLTLFNIYLELMNTVERNHWHHYMDHMGDGCQGQDCDFFHSGLTISLSSHFEGIASKNTLLLFDVPTDIEMVADTVEMLQMAHTVVKNRTKKEATTMINKISHLDRRASLSATDCSKCTAPLAGQDLSGLSSRKISNLDRRASLSSTDCSKCTSPLLAGQLDLSALSSQTNYKKARRSSLPLLMDKNPRGVSFSIPYNMNRAAVIRSPITDNSYSSKDLNTLSSWYRKIDERFADICAMREKYFFRYFELHIKQISSNVHSMFNALESLYLQQNDDDLKEIQENQMELRELFERYHTDRMLFRHLSVDIKDSEYEELIQVYLDTKIFDLNNHFVNLKRKHLDLCQQHLKFTFHSISTNLNAKFDA